MAGHKIRNVIPGSIGEELEIEPGDRLLAVNGVELEDIFDYHYQVNEEKLTLLIEKPDGEQWELEIEKDYDEDLGLEFEQALLNEYHSCRNKCIFCFIDQMPPGMRETLYFKDDDARLSFLQGNYITLTNMTDKDLERIIRFHLAPINISVHTTNPELRCKMLHNRFAGDVMEKMRKLYDSEILMNSQIVLCKGWNDGVELERTLKDLASLSPYMASLSVVPFGKTKYREGLTPIEKFNKEESAAVLEQIHAFQEKCLERIGTRFVYASDEWYLVAGQDIPEEDYYEGYGQLENGVGMMRCFMEEIDQALDAWQEQVKKRKVSLVTGVLASGIICDKMKAVTEKFPELEIKVYTIVNEFFGEDITVTGLLTGQDIIKQLRDKDLGEYLILPSALLRSGEEVLLDDITISDIEEALHIPIRIVNMEGEALLESILH